MCQTTRKTHPRQCIEGYLRAKYADIDVLPLSTVFDEVLSVNHRKDKRRIKERYYAECNELPKDVTMWQLIKYVNYLMCVS